MRTNSRTHTFRSRIFAVLLISILALPGVVPPVRIAAAPATAPPPAQAPPEPFRTGAVLTLSALIPIASSVRETLGEIGEIFSPSIPKGFESAKMPSLPERLVSAIPSAPAFFASTKSEIHLLGGDSDYGDIALANRLGGTSSEVADQKSASKFVDKEIRKRCR